jgi:hypothetical protein
MMLMKRYNLFKKVIALVSLITGFISCEKYNDDILYAEFKKVYGEWLSNKKCGGLSGDCYSYNSETLNITEYGEFKIVDTQDNYIKGHIKVISQDINSLKVRFDVKKGKLPLFSSDELFVTFNGNDTVIFNEGCCDRFSFEFIRKN